MAMAVPLDQPFGLHVVYMDPPVSTDPVEVTVSNPSVAVVEQQAIEHPGDPCWVRITAVTDGKFVVGVTDGVLRTSLQEMEGVAGADPLPDMEVILG